jgi:S1-C subfamily serine protease
VRDGKPVTAPVKLGELRAAKAESEPAEAKEGGKLGLSVEPLSPERAKQLGLETERGLLVAAVDPEGPAAEAGLRPGDVIQEVNRKPVADAASLKGAVKASGDRPALVLVSRNGESLFLTLDPRA